jgi:hypothetical protein
MIPARQIRATNAPKEENVTIKEHLPVGIVEANMAWGMPWGVKDTQSMSAERQFIAVLQFQIRRGAISSRHAKPGCAPGGI